MAQGTHLWSQTAASNATADSSIGWSEGQAPSSVNDSARAMMARIADLYKDLGGLTTGGTSTAFTVTSNRAFASAAVMAGSLICIIPNADSGASPTLAVDGLTARAINYSTGVAVPTGALKTGTPYLLLYVHASTEFIVLGALATLPAITATGTLTATGSTVAFMGHESISTEAAAAAGPIISAYRNSASPAASDFIGAFDFNGKDSGGNKTLFARLVAQITDATDTSEDAIVLLQAMVAGTLTTMLQSSAAGITVPGTLTSTGALTASAGFTVSSGSVSLPAGSVANAALVSPPATALIQTQTASSSSTIDFTTGLDDTYDAFEIRISNLKPSVDSTQILLRVGTGGGPTYQASGYTWTGIENLAGSGQTTRGSTSDTSIGVFGVGTGAGNRLGSASGENYSGIITFNNPEASDKCIFNYSGAGNEAAASNVMTYSGSGCYGTAGAITGIRILPDSGNWASGRFSLYGIKKS